MTSPQWRAALSTRRAGARTRIAPSRCENRACLTHVLPAADSSLPVVWDLRHLPAALGDELLLWIGSPRELDELRATIPSRSTWLFADEASDGSLRDLAALATMAETFDGHDSGPMHVAHALQVPVLGIFAPWQPKRTFPQGEAPWRVLQRATPHEIGAQRILDELTALRASVRLPAQQERARAR